MRPCGQHGWVRQTVAAVRWAGENGLSVVSSTGVAGWDLITAVASDMRLPLTLFLISSEKDWERNCREASREFDLEPSLTRFIPVVAKGGRGDRRSLMQVRDDLVCNCADLILPVAIGRKGSMRGRLERARAQGIAVDERFLCQLPDSSGPVGYKLDRDGLTDEVASQSDEFFVHWTRAANGPWPDERCLDYWRSVVSSDAYPRSGFETLRHIVASRRIIASSRHLRKETMAVGFSDLPPREAVKLMRYRARYREMSFEPYGVALRKRAGLALGIEPVVYTSGAAAGSSEVDLWRLQSIGRRSDWRGEREFRVPRDVDLRRVAARDLVLFTRYRSEAELLSAETGFRAIPFFENE